MLLVFRQMARKVDFCKLHKKRKHPLASIDILRIMSSFGKLHKKRKHPLASIVLLRIRELVPHQTVPRRHPSVHPSIVYRRIMRYRTYHSREQRQLQAWCVLDAFSNTEVAAPSSLVVPTSPRCNRAHSIYSLERLTAIITRSK